MRVTVWFEISDISKDELRHAGYCGVRDLRYYYRWALPCGLLFGWKSQVYLKMNFAMCVTVGLEISRISIDELRHAGSCRDGDLRYIYRWTSPCGLVCGWRSQVISVDELRHSGYCGVGGLGYICRWTSPCGLLCGWRSRVYLERNFAMCVTVWLEISGISKDELSHGCYCGVTDLGYIYRWTPQCGLLSGWRFQVYLKMNFAKSVTVWLEISGISIDELRHVCYCVVWDLRYIYIWTLPCVLLCGLRSQVYLKMNFAMSVTVWLKISVISTDELNHVCYCVVEDLRYYYRWT
jgi:hypothetical protein